MDVDLTPLVEVSVPLFFAVVSALGAWAARWFVRKLKLDGDETVRLYLLDVLDTAVEFAEKRTTAYIDRGLSGAHLRNAKVAAAAGYVVEQVPDALAHFNLTRESVRRMVDARLYGPAQTNELFKDGVFIGSVTEDRGTS
jgi:hypothetical protein|tara:strand:- start:6595 stop:7014 length:420 start_codon:yes stop_codon:yes gene_type:complete